MEETLAIARRRRENEEFYKDRKPWWTKGWSMCRQYALDAYLCNQNLMSHREAEYCLCYSTSFKPVGMLYSRIRVSKSKRLLTVPDWLRIKYKLPDEVWMCITNRLNLYDLIHLYEWANVVFIK